MVKANRLTLPICRQPPPLPCELASPDSTRAGLVKVGHDFSRVLHLNLKAYACSALAEFADDGKVMVAWPGGH